MKRLIYRKPMSPDKRFYVETRFNKGKNVFECHGERETIETAEYWQHQGHMLLQIVDDIGLVYMICEVK